MDIKLLNAVLNIACRLTEAGAEVSRIEESVTRICYAYGCKNVDAYATTTQLVVTIETKDGQFLTLQRRVSSINTDIEKLDRLNSLVRNISSNPFTLEQIESELKKIELQKKVPKAVLPLFYGIIAAAFCLFFGSRKIEEIGVSFLIGFFVGIIYTVLDTVNLNKILVRFVCSVFAAFSVRFFISTGFVSNPDYIIIGNIMSLIPGIGLTNALRDLFTGDTITGILRSIEALLLTIAIALGFALPAILFGGAF